MKKKDCLGISKNPNNSYKGNCEEAVSKALKITAESQRRREIKSIQALRLSDSAVKK
jgi:hypothetical protein